MDDNQYFQSSDLALVSALCCLGYNIDTVDRTNPNRAVFYVERNKELDNCIAAYWSRTLQIDPLSYFNTLKQVKTRLYSSDIY